MRSRAVWSSSQETFRSKVIGPVFGRMCRMWAEDFAADERLGGPVSQALSGTVYDPRKRMSHDVDVAVLGADGTLRAIGEVKWGDTVDMRHLQRLETVVDLLEARDQRPEVIVLFSGAGFTADVERAASRSGGRIQLVDLERLYNGE